MIGPLRWAVEAFDAARRYVPAGTLPRTDAPREPAADTGAAWKRRGLVVTPEGPLHLDVVAGSIG